MTVNTEGFFKARKESLQRGSIGKGMGPDSLPEETKQSGASTA